ncbi:MAG: hypothetical protein LUD84_01780 [Clostridiales bacterium]|nr:hypothetical protein [Clostridiales bacterium]
MTLEELIQEGEIAGIPPWELENLTWGEAAGVVRACRERERRRAQRQAAIAWQQAGLIAQAMTEGRMDEVYEVFPYWNEEEIRQRKVEKYRQMMERHAGAQTQAANRETTERGKPWRKKPTA